MFSSSKPGTNSFVSVAEHKLEPLGRPLFWGRLDGIAIINLDDRPERWQATRAELSKFREAPVPLRVSAVRGTTLPGYGMRPWFRGRTSDIRWAARVGCTLSHRKVMALAQELGWKTFLVLEDDACLKSLEGLVLEELDRALFQVSQSWEVCYLGFSKTVGPSLKVGQVGCHELREVVGCYTTHAYLVREPARDWILRQLPSDTKAWSWHAQHRIIDRWYVRHMSRALRVHALTPSLITQRAGFSDIVQRQVNYSNEFGAAMADGTTSRRAFNLYKRYAHVQFALADIYDGMRGLIKRLNGF